MIEIKDNIFHTIAAWKVNPVNCVGVAGKGLALQFKKRYPGNFKLYQTWCKCGDARPGVVLPDYSASVISFPTKVDWRAKSDILYVREGLIALGNCIRAMGIKSIAIPALGCGLGGLEWSDVRNELRRFDRMLPDVVVYVYLPD